MIMSFEGNGYTFKTIHNVTDQHINILKNNLIAFLILIN